MRLRQYTCLLALYVDFNVENRYVLDRQTDRQTDRQAARQAGRQAGR